MSFQKQCPCCSGQPTALTVYFLLKKLFYNLGESTLRSLTAQNWGMDFCEVGKFYYKFDSNPSLLLPIIHRTC